MTSMPSCEAEFNSGSAVAKLVKKENREIAVARNALYEKLLETYVDQLYAEAFARARGQEAKVLILQQYIEQPESGENISAWVKNAIRGLNLTVATIDRRKKPEDQVKNAIATIKTAQPNISHLKICSRLDAMNVQLPERWRTASNYTWSHAFRNETFRPRLKSYFSKI
jgi:hypothetical protein